MREKKHSLVIMPTYSAIFQERKEEIIAKLKAEGLAEKFVVYTTYFSSLLYTTQIKGVDVQERIMMEFRDVLINTRDGKVIQHWLISHNVGTLNMNNYTLMELYRILLNHKNGKCENLSISTDEKLIYLKLVLIANDDRLRNTHEFCETLATMTSDDQFAYEKRFWPLLLQETDENESIRIEYEMFRLKYFIDGITNEHPKLKGVINSFFKEKGFDDYRTYASCIAIFFLDYITSFTNNDKLKMWIKGDEKIQKMLDPLVINDVVVDSYLSLKTHPVYYYKGNYYIIHWNYLLSQIYIGTFMGLKARIESCGIKEIKTEVGTIMERTFLKNVLTVSFGELWQHVLFDDNKEGLPDAMFRMGNNLFVIELKDNLMREDVMESCDYEYIEKHFYKTFIRSSEKRKKGITQLCLYIKNFINNKYEKNGFPYNGKLNIYPIIMYTDYKYRINGLNHYFGENFKELVKADDLLMSVTHRLHPLTVIGLDCMFNLQMKFQHKKVKFADAIDKYHKHIKLTAKRNADKGIDKYSQLYPSFDRYLPENRNIIINKDEIQTILKDFFNIENAV